MRFLRRLLLRRDGMDSARLPFSRLLHEPGLWHFGRRSVVRATGLGLFVAFLPLPQLLTVTVLVILMRINLPVALAMIMVTNPLTMAPAFYLNYRVGAWLLNRSLPSPPADFGLDWLLEQFGSIWLPLWLGSVVVGSIAGVTGLLAVHYIWQARIHYRRRHRRYLR
jgi:uncharacterized protein (DUF2062 family)